MNFLLQLQEEFDELKKAIGIRRAAATDVSNGMVRFRELGSRQEGPALVAQLMPRQVRAGDSVVVINVPGIGTPNAAPVPIVLGPIATSADPFVGLTTATEYDTLPVASEDYRGQLAYLKSDLAGDIAYMCLLAADGNFGWFQLLAPQIGGTT